MKPSSENYSAAVGARRWLSPILELEWPEAAATGQQTAERPDPSSLQPYGSKNILLLGVASSDAPDSRLEPSVLEMSNKAV